MPVYSLSFHAGYTCRHSGACCTAGWPIPVETRLLPILGVDVLLPDTDGVCGHFDRGTHLCDVQRDHGEDMLPGTCHQFPRRALIDERGTFVTLSNFCPTAATLLCDSDLPLAIVSSPPAFPPSRSYEGLDARRQWPPLVRADLLFDLESYSLWEHFVVSTFASELAVDDGLMRIAAAAEMVRAWTPDRGLFHDWVTTALQTGSNDAGALQLYDRFRTADGFEALRHFVPEGLQAPASPPLDGALTVAPGWNGHWRAVRRYLASKAFASWAAYEGRGVRTLVAELVVSELVLRAECARACEMSERPLDRALMIEAIRQSDRFLIHLIERPRLIQWLGAVETATSPSGL